RGAPSPVGAVRASDRAVVVVVGPVRADGALVGPPARFGADLPDGLLVRRDGDGPLDAVGGHDLVLRNGHATRWLHKYGDNATERLLRECVRPALRVVLDCRVRPARARS